MKTDNIQLMKAIVSKDIKTFAPKFEEMIQQKIREKTQGIFQRTMMESGFRPIGSGSTVKDE